HVSLLLSADTVVFAVLYNSIYSLQYFFFNHPTTTDIYTLSLHDALPILSCAKQRSNSSRFRFVLTVNSSRSASRRWLRQARTSRSEEHTSELQSRGHLVCRLLLEKKKTK